MFTHTVAFWASNRCPGTAQAHAVITECLGRVVSNRFRSFHVRKSFKCRLSWLGVSVTFSCFFPGNSSRSVSSGYRGLLPRGWSDRGVKFTTHLHVVSRLRMRGDIPPVPLGSRDGVLLSQAQGQLHFLTHIKIVPQLCFLFSSCQ
jgi:hypothetical protein